MATQVRSKPASKAPVTKHPLFPAMVALWFGALFGLGSLAVRASLFESLVLSLSLDVLLPAAAPPLGLKARLILALLLAAIGVAVGAYLARRIARPKPVATPRRRGVGSRFASRGARSEPAVEVEVAATRRRPLTIETEERPMDEFDAAPLPGGSPAIFDVTQMDFSLAGNGAGDQHVPEQPARCEEAPLALDPFVIEEPAQTGYAPDRQVFGMASPAPRIDDYPAAEESEPTAPQFHPPASAAVPPQDAPLELLPDQQFLQSAELPVQAEVGEYAEMIESLRQFESPAAANASEQHAPLQWTGEPPADSDEESSEVRWSDEALPVIPPVLLTDPLPLHSESIFDTTTVRRIDTAELGELSPVELVERLALAMRQRAHKGSVPEALVDAVSSLVATTPDDARPCEPVAPQTAEIEPAPLTPPLCDSLDRAPRASEVLEVQPEELQPASVGLALPAALRPIDFADYADHDDQAEPVLPPRSFAAPIVAEPVAATGLPAEPDLAGEGALPPVNEAETEVPEDSYSSLLELGRPNPVRQDFVRIEEAEEDHAAIEPVVIFPGHGARPGLRFAAPDPAAQADAPADAAVQTGALADSGVPQLRRFDAPATTATPASTSMAGGIRQDPEEAQRALRSALATLQRMSGAA